MKKHLFLYICILALTSAFVFAEDDNELTRVVISKGITGINSEPTYARNINNSSSVIIWTNTSTTDHTSKIYAVYVKPKTNGSFKFSKPRLISNKTDYNFVPSIAYNYEINSYMVVWASQIKNNDTHLLGRKLSATGRPKGPIIKISSENLASNMYPRIAAKYTPMFLSPPATKARFTIVWDKGWPTYVNKSNGLHCINLDVAGKPVGSETFVFAAPLDDKTGEPVSLLVSNIAQVFGGFYYVAVNRGFSNNVIGPDTNRETWIMMFTEPSDFKPAKRAFMDVRTAGQLTGLADQGVLISWFDGFDKQLSYSRSYGWSLKKAGKISNPVKKEITYNSYVMIMWSDLYLYNYGGNGETKVYKLTAKGAVDEHVGTLILEDPIGEDMIVYQANSDFKAMIVANVITDDRNFLSDIVAYHFLAPGWDSLGPGAPPAK